MPLELADVVMVQLLCRCQVQGWRVNWRLAQQNSLGGRRVGRGCRCHVAGEVLGLGGVAAGWVSSAVLQGDSPIDLWPPEPWGPQVSGTESLCSTAEEPVPMRVGSCPGGTHQRCWTGKLFFIFLDKQKKWKFEADYSFGEKKSGEKQIDRGN